MYRFFIRKNFERKAMRYFCLESTKTGLTIIPYILVTAFYVSSVWSSIFISSLADVWAGRYACLLMFWQHFVVSPFFCSSYWRRRRVHKVQSLIAAFPGDLTMFCVNTSLKHLCVKMTSSNLHLYSKKEVWCGKVRKSIMRVTTVA